MSWIRGIVVHVCLCVCVYGSIHQIPKGTKTPPPKSVRSLAWIILMAPPSCLVNENKNSINNGYAHSY